MQNVLLLLDKQPEDTKPTDKGFCDRRIKDAEKTYRAQKKNIESYNEYLEKIDSGKEIKRINGDLLTRQDVENWIENAEEIMEQAISKITYYKECLEDLGGVQFSKDNIKVGYIIELARWGKCRVIGTGKVNMKYQIMEGSASGLGGTASYAEIVKVISTDIEEAPKHPFKVGEEYTVDAWNSDTCEYESKIYVVIKITDQRVTLKCGTERAVSRKPRRFKTNNLEGYLWALGITDGRNGTVYKKEE